MPERNTIQLLAFCGPLAALMFFAADIVGSLLTPGYSMAKQAVSELMEVGAPYKHIVDPLLIVYHGLVIPFAVGLHRALPGGARGWIAAALLGIAGLAGVALTLFFPCDPGCEPFVSLRGTLHIFIAVPMGFSILFAILGFSFRLAHDKEWRVYRLYSMLTFVAGIAMAVTTVLLAETEWVGWLERALTWVYLQWYAVMGVVAAVGARRTK